MKNTFYTVLALANLFLPGPSSARSQETVHTARSAIAPGPLYPNSADGLRQLLQHVLAAAKSRDDGTVEAAIRDMEIPNSENWFVNTFGEEKGESWAQPYAKGLRKNEKQLRELFEQLAHKDGAIFAFKVESYARPGNLEWGLSHGLKRHADFYRAEFSAPGIAGNGAGDIIGFFVFVDGAFRWDSTIQVAHRLPILPISTTGVQSYRPAPAPSADQSCSGTVYTSELPKSSLTVPPDWQTNDELARARFGIGAFSSRDRTTTLLIQQIPGASEPEEIAKEFDAQLNHLSAGYRTISDSHITVDGKDCEAIEFQFTDTTQAGDGVFVPVPLQKWMVFVPVPRGHVVFDFVTSSSLFESEQPIFQRIVRSYHSLEP